MSYHRNRPVYSKTCVDRDDTLDKETRWAITKTISEIKEMLNGGMTPAGKVVDFSLKLLNDIKQASVYELHVCTPGKEGTLISKAAFSYTAPAPKPVSSGGPRTKLFDSRGLLIGHDQKMKLQRQQHAQVQPQEGPWKILLERALHIMNLVDQYRSSADVLVHDVPAAWDDHAQLVVIRDKWMDKLEGLGVDCTGPALSGDLAPYMQSLVWPIVNGYEIKGIENAMKEDVVLNQFGLVCVRVAELESGAVSVPAPIAVQAPVQELVLSRRAKKRERAANGVSLLAGAGPVPQPEFALTDPVRKNAAVLDTAAADAGAMVSTEQARREATAQAAETVALLEVGPAVNVETADEQVEPAVPAETPVAELAAGAGSGA